jgi:transcriptional regulator with XRE-family HTH domain
MLLSETLCYMNTRQIAGSIIRDELARQGLKHEKAAQRMGVARSTLSRIVEGNESVRRRRCAPWRACWGSPAATWTSWSTVTLERIARLKDMDPDLRRHTLDALDEAAQDGGEDSQDKHRRRG